MNLMLVRILFLIEIRININWDHQKFIKLLRNMYYYSDSNKETDTLNREYAGGFWYLSHFVEDWTTHENFRKNNPLSNDYYEEAYEMIYALSYWYFNQDPLL